MLYCSVLALKYNYALKWLLLICNRDKHLRCNLNVRREFKLCWVKFRPLTEVANIRRPSCVRKVSRIKEYHNHWKYWAAKASLTFRNQEYFIISEERNHTWCAERKKKATKHQTFKSGKLMYKHNLRGVYLCVPMFPIVCPNLCICALCPQCGRPTKRDAWSTGSGAGHWRGAVDAPGHAQQLLLFRHALLPLRRADVRAQVRFLDIPWL